MIWTNIGLVTIFSIAFASLEVAYITCSNFATKVLKQDGFDSVGFYSLAANFTLQAVFSFFAAPIVNKLHYRYTMTISSLCYAFWILCFILPAFYAQYKHDHHGAEPTAPILSRGLIEFLLVFTAGITGIGAGIHWVAQGKFISECACEENKGFFNSYFWSFYASSGIIGNVIAGEVFQHHSSQSTLFIIFAVLAVGGSFANCLLWTPKKPASK